LWDFFDKITSFRRFQNSAVLKVTKESVEVANLLDKNMSITQTWTGLQIEVDLPLDVLEKIRHILEHVELISFVISEERLEDYNFCDECYVKFIAGVLSSTPKLTALQMDIAFFLTDLSEVWSSPIIRDHLKNLESLELPYYDLDSNAAKNSYRTIGGTRTYRRVEDPYYFIPEESATSLQQLVTILETAHTRLKRLRVSKFTVDEPDEPDEVRPFLRSFGAAAARSWKFSSHLTSGVSLTTLLQ